MDIREIEIIVDNNHKGHDGFKYSKATTILNLLRSFEDGCRLIGMAEMGMTGSKEMMEMNNRFFMDALDIAVKWAYIECTDDNSIELTVESDRYLCCNDLLINYAKPYCDICSAYISYSRGFFTSTVSGRNVTFAINKPVPKILNADYAVELGHKYNRDYGELYQRIESLKAIRDDLISSISVLYGHINYTIASNVWEKTKSILEYHYDVSSELPNDWIIDEFSLQEYREVWVALAAWMFIHSQACIFSGIKGGALEDVVLLKTLEEIIEFIKSKTNVDDKICDKIINLLIYDYTLKNNDIAYQPIIRLTTEFFALSPSLFINSNPERNLISIIQKYQNKTEYSIFTNRREALMAESVLNEISGSHWLTKTNVRIPSPLPDIDLLILDKQNSALLLCELKWLNSADSTSEVYARQDDIDKGVKQSAATLQFTIDNTEDCLQRAFDRDIISDIDISNMTIGACVISKNIIRTTLDTVPVLHISQFIELYHQLNFNLVSHIKAIEERTYLSGLPSNFSENYHTIHYAGYNFNVPAIEFEATQGNKKIGRNEPCPCGKANPASGKPIKYKKCCGK